MASCFVIQGFGVKTDFTNGRKINLDASYLVIKEAVQEAGLTCIRADEIQHSGTIDEPMYKNILNAELVICDLSTYNLNAAYELGVRYALRKSATIIIAESEFKNPFDFSHIVIRNYKHLGDDIGLQEARRFKQELVEAITVILNLKKVDSPVYTFLPSLSPPSEDKLLGLGLAETFKTGYLKDEVDSFAATPFKAGRPEAAYNHWALGVTGTGGDPVKVLMDAAELAMQKSDFISAKAYLNSVLEKRPDDPYVIQRKALATYKSKLPDPVSALNEARDVIKSLEPHTSHDGETLGLWAAVHKRLWFITYNRDDLEQAIFAVQKGFILQNDYYNGINFAYLLNVRAALSAPMDAIADFVLANRVRKLVIGICEMLLKKYSELTESATSEPRTPEEENKREKELVEQYWITATIWEAWEGLCDAAESARWEQQCSKMAGALWMFETTKEQVGNLRQLLGKSSPLGFIQNLEPSN